MGLNAEMHQFESKYLIGSRLGMLYLISWADQKDPKYTRDEIFPFFQGATLCPASRRFVPTSSLAFSRREMCQWQSNPSLCDYQKTLTRSSDPYPIELNGYVKQSWTDSNRKNCYPIDILMNNCKTGELLGENVVATPCDRVNHSLFASSALYFTHPF
jgi:hypothetical protein